MSYTTILEMPQEGELTEVAEFNNSWGSAMRVWMPMAMAYLADPEANANQEMGRIMLSGDMCGLWKLVDGDKLTRAERIVLAWTFDKSVCEYSKLVEMAELFREFDKQHPVPGKVNHLPAFADLYEKMGLGIPSDALGLCVIQTSVTSYVWDGVQPEDQEARCPRYDASKDTGHSFIFEEYDKELDKIKRN